MSATMPERSATALDPEQDAQQVLHDYWAEGSAGVSLPVDPVNIARQLGLDVFAAQLDRDVSGVLLKEKGSGPVIYLNVYDAGTRQRFSCAHEIGHYMRRRTSDEPEFGYVDRRAALASTGTDPEEVYANKFAASLLMPADIIRSVPERDPGKLAAVFGVSVEAMRHRLKNLGVA